MRDSSLDVRACCEVDALRFNNLRLALSPSSASRTACLCQGESTSFTASMPGSAPAGMSGSRPLAATRHRVAQAVSDIMHDTCCMVHDAPRVSPHLLPGQHTALT